jgi:hypothetical protein
MLFLVHDFLKSFCHSTEQILIYLCSKNHFFSTSGGWERTKTKSFLPIFIGTTPENSMYQKNKEQTTWLKSNTPSSFWFIISTLLILSIHVRKWTELSRFWEVSDRSLLWHNP